jgi:hypothetical protein
MKLITYWELHFDQFRAFFKNLNFHYSAAKFCASCLLTALCVCEFLAKNKMTVIPHPLYSTDLVLCHFFVFPKLRMALKGRSFNHITIIPVKFQDALAKFQTVHVRMLLMVV